MEETEERTEKRPQKDIDTDVEEMAMKNSKTSRGKKDFGRD